MAYFLIAGSFENISLISNGLQLFFLYLPCTYFRRVVSLGPTLSISRLGDTHSFIQNVSRQRQARWMGSFHIKISYSIEKVFLNLKHAELRFSCHVELGSAQ